MRTSKLSFRHLPAHLQRLMTLAGGTVPFHSASRFAAAGMVGAVTDVLLFQLFTSLGATPAGAYGELFRRRCVELLSRLEMVVPAPPCG